MKFEYLLEDLLNEASPQEIYQQYYSDIPEPTFQKIVSADPQSVVNQGVIKRIGKYSKLFLKLFKEGSLKLEDLPKGTEYLGHVYKRNIPININNIKSLADLYEIVKKHIVESSPDLETVMSILDKNEYKYVLNGQKWIILIPKTEIASCYLGAGTQWCTTWGKNSLNKSYRDRENHFARHHKQGPLYILINKFDSSDKYQFHFETKQYMNPADRQIIISEFLDENPEILKFFFPSLYNENSVDDDEIARADVLSNKTGILLMNKFTKDTDNPLVKSIITNDIRTINELITDNSLSESVDVRDGYIIFEFRKFPYNLTEISNKISSLEGMKRDSWGNVHSTIIDNVKYGGRWEEELEYIFKNYFEQNQSQIKSMTQQSLNYEKFKFLYFEDFYNNEKIQDKYTEVYTDSTYGNYEAEIDIMINEIKKYINFNSGYYSNEAKVPIFRFIQYIVGKEITMISDVGDLLSDYCNGNGIDAEYYEDLYNYEMVLPTYEKMSYEVENYFDDLFDLEDGSSKCTELRQKFNDVIKGVFEGNYTFENEHVYIDIPKPSIDCQDESVYITYRNKDSGKSYKGNVKIDNLASYATNYKLFESFISFKKIIK